MSIILANGSRF